MVAPFGRIDGRTLAGRAGVVALLLLAGCSGSDGGTGPETSRPTTVSLTPSSTTLTYIGATVNISAKILDQNGSPLTGSLTWTTSAPTVATVSGTGQVTAVANGTATVTATSGSISGTVAVTVQQAVSSLTVVAGDNQSAIAGDALAEQVVVRARDLGGAGVAGATVTFTPAAGSGSVSATSVATDSEGNASTIWTLGSAFGPQQLTATAGTGIAVSVKASSKSPVPLPDLVTGGSLLVSRTDPTTLETLSVQTSIRNDGDAGTGQSFRVSLKSNGVELESLTVPEMAPGGSETFTFNVGPLDAGTRTLTFEVDPDGVVEELLESNNMLSRDVRVAVQTLISAPTTLTNVGASTGEDLLFRLDLPTAANNLTVELSGGTGDVDLYIERGERPAVRDLYNDCQSGSPTTAERCQLSGVTAGTYHILLNAFTTFSGTTMTVSLDGEVLPFNIEVVFIDHGTEAQDAVFLQAAAMWEGLIPVDIPDSDFSIQPFPADQCLAGQPEVSGVIDDIRIYVSIDSIDGPSGTLAQAGPCTWRGLGNLPLLGSMSFDQDDMDALDGNGELLAVVLHEMGHVLGLGTTWSLSDYFHNPSRPSNAGVDTYFDGPLAVAAFDAAGGTGYTGGQKVPVENTAEAGSADGHWRETVLKRELMTPFFNRGSANPLSAISVQAMADLGYTVDVSKAEPFSGSFSAPSPASALRGGADDVLDLSGDLRDGPHFVVDQKGRVTQVLRR